MTTDKGKINVNWDLSPFFKSFEDPNIQKALETVERETETFVKDFKDQIDDPTMTPQYLRTVLQRQEAIHTALYGPMMYASLNAATDMDNKQALSLLNTVKKAETTLQKKFAFVELEIGSLLSERRAEFLEAESLQVYKHHLERILRKYPHKLGEEQEQLVLDKDLYGANGWSELQSKWLSTKEFSVEIEGKTRTISWSEAQGLMSNPNRETRKAVIEGTMRPLKEQAEIFAFALRNICGSHLVDYDHRNYPNPMESSLIKNDITKDVIDNLYATIEDNLDIFQEFLDYKANLFGSRKLQGYDLWAPHPEKEKEEITWDKAKDLIFKTYQSFDEEMFNIVKAMFEENRIDATPQMGKRGGAFCASDYFTKESWVFMSFNGTMDNVGTLAHELGHAIHGYLVNEKQPLFNSRKSMCLAEVASEFGRFLLLDKLMTEEVDDPELKKIMLYDHIENLCIVIFEVASRTNFETSLYEAMQSGQYLDGDTISELFVESRQNYFGDPMDFMPEQTGDWMWKPHYFMHGLRYYNYPYVVAEMLVLALFQKFKQEGDTFIPKLKDFLAAGSEKSPKELAQTIFEVDLTDKDFWQLGFDQMRDLLDELKAMD